MTEKVVSYEGSGGVFDARLVGSEAAGHVIRAAFSDFENPKIVYENPGQEQQGLDLSAEEIDELTSIE